MNEETRLWIASEVISHAIHIENLIVDKGYKETRYEQLQNPTWLKSIYISEYLERPEL